MTDWTKYTHARDADGKIVPVEIAAASGREACVKLLGPHTAKSGREWPKGEKWWFESDGTSDTGLTLLTAAEAEAGQPEQDPPMWAKEVFCERAGSATTFVNLINEGARTIAKYEEEPEDPDMALARESVAKYWEGKGCSNHAERVRDRLRDADDEVQTAFLAIKAVRKELAQ